MGTLEERIGRLEGRMQEQADGIADLRSHIVRLDTKMSDGFARLDAKMSDMETRFESKLSGHGVRLDGKIDRLDAKIDRLDDKTSRQFVWLVGMMVTVLGAVAGGLLSR
jgi:uncharacterized coiled-coil protein SlyX